MRHFEKCSWDLIQFNVGHHIKGPQASSYETGLREAVKLLRRLAPNALLVFASTTPSPFDSNATFPNFLIGNCLKRGHLFLRGGVVPEYNRIAQKVMAEMKVAFNDRYSAVNSDLRRFQNRCDIHYNPEGYNFLAENDWDVFARLLRLKH